MKIWVVVLGSILFGWGTWIFVADRPASTQLAMQQGCESLFDTPGVRNLEGSAGDELGCHGKSRQEKERLELWASIAIIVGGIMALAGGRLWYLENQSLSDHESQSR